MIKFNHSYFFMANKKLLLVLPSILALALVVGTVVLADENPELEVNENTGEVGDVNDIDLKDVPADHGWFNMLGTITAVNPASQTIAVNGVTVDVSEAKIVGFRWKKFVSAVSGAESNVKPFKEWWRHWTLDELKEGDRVRVGGRVEDGSLKAKLVVVRAFRIAERLRSCTVDDDCSYLLPPGAEGKLQAKCVESRCRLVPTGGQVGEEEEESGATTVGPVTPRPHGLQEIQSRLQEILERIREIQSKLGAMVGGAF